ncbi:MAG: hypothetical protein ACJ8AW_44410 [Rhodopila sp.]
MDANSITTVTAFRRPGIVMQCGNCRLSIVNKESSMQSKSQLPTMPTSPAPVQPNQGAESSQTPNLTGGLSFREFFAIPDVYPESLLRYDEAISRISYADATLSENPRPDPWWNAIPAALSWIMAFLIEGFAAYGAAMQPGFFQPYETGHPYWYEPDNAAPETHSGRGGAVAPVDGSPVEDSPVTTSRWPVWLRAPLTWLSGDQPSTGRMDSIATGLEDLDDWILQDIGYLDYEAAYLVSQGRQWG